jgi:hypothetical protein
MTNAVVLNNSWQAFLVKQAIVREIERYEKLGFTPTSLELRELRGSLKLMKPEQGLPILSEEQLKNLQS